MKRQGTRTQSTNARNLVTIRYRVMTPDGEGGHTETWYDRQNVWAEICPIMARQVYEYAAINVQATHRIKILGNLSFQTNTKRESEVWAVTWSGILGATVKIHYQIDGGAWVEIEASVINSGSYAWTIPAAAIGRRVIVRVAHLTDADSYVLTDPYNVVASDAVDGLPAERDQIVWTVGTETRTFEIKTVENLQERGIQAVITCLERRD
jgi:head-tail adaptor